MGPQKARKKPVEIEFWVFDGTVECGQDIVEWAGSKIYLDTVPSPHLVIPTLEGTMTGSPEDVIIRGVQGEFYPCKPDIFEATYDVV